ncbi:MULTISPECIES: hypothetical protein [Paraburkholderia]|jgi:hypothetical protein|uniref:Uncharacterized protein n=1 Tax=Paraburkholderia madseniana TaxID=2599607 RepID=A0A6N6WG00_9BURK|nr:MULTISPECIES: hypothetical protein [Paraburkholderia]KAE8759592.1 hypothetical protein FSO04_12830 [Paraburkholderia madseniana]MCX4144448.1 hypothetical protein [Paraburkholderia madseniana]MDN7147401.1 hypothetical protein [Paraburkholderia sp. WS6]MDQ6406281.1 hypothetical protein [Paraburkholderia madseniana]
MRRTLKPQERQLLEFLISVNAPLYRTDVARWMEQIRTCTVREVNVQYCLSISHDEKSYGGWENSKTLAHELIAVDEGVPVLIYAIVHNTQAGFVLHSFNIDRLDGEPLVNYPEAGDGLMIVERNKRVGGADLCHLYGGSGS